MEKINLLKVSPETRKTIKAQAIRLHKKDKAEGEIAELLNISYQAVSRIIRAYKKEGMTCLKEKKRGRKSGEKRKLTAQQEKEIQGIIIDKCPDQVKIAAVAAELSCRKIAGQFCHQHRTNLVRWSPV